jgi:hypothetical protein
VEQIRVSSGLFLGAKNKKRIPFFKNKAEKLLILNRNGIKTKLNKPKNKAEKLLKTRSCGKNEPKTNRKTNRAMLLKIHEVKKWPDSVFRN